MRPYSRYQNALLIKNGTKVRNGLRDKLDTTKREDDMLYTIQQSERIDNLAYKFYGRPDLWWVIADYNDLLFPLVLEEGTVLRLPSYEHVFSNLLGG